MLLLMFAVGLLMVAWMARVAFTRYRGCGPMVGFYRLLWIYLLVSARGKH